MIFLTESQPKRNPPKWAPAIFGNKV